MEVKNIIQTPVVYLGSLTNSFYVLDKILLVHFALNEFENRCSQLEEKYIGAASSKNYGQNQVFLNRSVQSDVNTFFDLFSYTFNSK